MRNVNWLAVLSVLMMILAIGCAVMARSYAFAGLVVALLSIGVAVLVIADTNSRSN